MTEISLNIACLIESYVPLYKHFSFRVADESTVPATSLTNWAMLRDSVKSPEHKYDGGKGVACLKTICRRGVWRISYSSCLGDPIFTILAQVLYRED